MTLIVAIKQEDNSILMGSDRCLTFNSTQYMVMGDSKIIRTGDMILGCSGSNKPGQILMNHFFPPERNPKISDLFYMRTEVADEMTRLLTKHKNRWDPQDGKEDLEMGILIAYRGEIYNVSEAIDIDIASTPYFAIGAAAEYALGVFHANTNGVAKNVLMKALKAGEYFCPSVTGPFDVLELEPPKPLRKPKKK